MLRRGGRRPAAAHAGRPPRSPTLSALLALAALFAATAWLYRGAKAWAELQRRQHELLLLQQQQSGDSEAAERLAAAGAGNAAGRLVGSQLTSRVGVPGGSLFTWGLDDGWRLGRVGGDASAPQLTLPRLLVASAAASRHSLLATSDGRVLSMGPLDSAGGGGHGSRPLAASGQLGRPGGQAPAEVRGPLAGKRVVRVAAGRYHSAAVTEDGELWTFGLNDWGQLGRLAAPAAAQGPACGHGWSCSAAEPGRVAALGGVRVVAAAAGRYSTLALDAEGRLWTMGLDACAAGEVPAREDAWRPRAVRGALEGQRVAAFDVGYTFWLAATADGSVFTCDTGDDGYGGTLPGGRGANNAGQLGRPGPDFHTPRRVESEALAASRVVAVAAGREHALAATSSGQVLTWGGGRSVRGREGPAAVPGLVQGALAGHNVRYVAAGEYFSLAATATQVFAWGSNAYLCLGAGNASVQELLLPAAVTGELGGGARRRPWAIRGIFAGYQHALAIADRPGDEELEALRRGGSGGSGGGGGGGGEGGGGEGGGGGGAGGRGGGGGVEVVLTEEQRRRREQWRREQEARGAQEAGGAAARPAAAAGAAQAAAGQGGAGAPSPAAPAPAAADRAAEARAAVAEACARLAAGGAPPAAAFHSLYLGLHPPPPPAPAHEVWAAWRPGPWREQLASLSRDVFDLLGSQRLNPEHKNPCFGGLGPSLSCLPFFNIIGVSKCGTTDLYHRLTMHQQVLPATNKGPHFWDECVYPPRGPCSAGPSGDFRSYVNVFSRAADLIRSRPQAVTGEASSNTFTSANGVFLRGFRGDKPWAEWAGAAGPNATMPALLREAQPYLRLILLLRDPADRLYSAFHYYRWWEDKSRPPPTPDGFHARTMDDIQEWRACEAARGRRECVRGYRPQQLVKGMYSEFLQDWLDHFPRSQLLVLRYEDYVAATGEHLRAVLRFLGVPQPDEGTWAAMTGAPAENRRSYPPMRPDTRAALRAFYAPFNRALSEALGGDCRWLWGEPASGGGGGGGDSRVQARGASSPG